MTALCALIAVSSPALAGAAATRLAASPAPVQCQVVLWWLQSSFGTPQAGPLAASDAAAFLEAAPLQELTTHDVARLLAALEYAADNNAGYQQATHRAGHPHRAANVQHVSPAAPAPYPASLAPVSSAATLRRSLAPHLAQLLSGTRSNRYHE